MRRNTSSTTAAGDSPLAVGCVQRVDVEGEIGEFGHQGAPRVGIGQGRTAQAGSTNRERLACTERRALRHVQLSDDAGARWMQDVISVFIASSIAMGASGDTRVALTRQPLPERTGDRAVDRLAARRHVHARRRHVGLGRRSVELELAAGAPARKLRVEGLAAPRLRRRQMAAALSLQECVVVGQRELGVLDVELPVTAGEGLAQLG